MALAAVGIELRSTCDACGRPLSINRLASPVRCEWCNHENAIEPEVWDHLLHEPMAQAADLNAGESGLVSQTHHRRTYTLSYTTVEMPPRKRRRPRDPDFAVGLLTGLVATAGEQEDEVRPAIGAVDTRCTSCGGAVPVDGTVRSAPCPFCGVALVIPDDLWRRFHPGSGTRRWILLTEAPEPLEEATWAGDAIATPDGGIVYAGTVSTGAGLFCENAAGRTLWRRLDLGKKVENLRFCFLNGVIWLTDRRRVLLLDAASGVTLQEPDISAIRDARELCPCPDGRILAFTGRGKRVTTDGVVTGAWVAPTPLGFFARMFSDPEPTGPYEATDARFAVGPDGSVWQIGLRPPGYPFVACLDPEGRRLWSKDLEDVQPTGSPPQPGPDGAWFFVWGDQGARVVGFSNDGKKIPGPDWGSFKDGAWDGVPRLLRTPAGGVVYDHWGKVRRFTGGAVVGNTQARDADREAAEWDDPGGD